MNALKHGMLAKSQILDDEQPGDFELLAATWRKVIDPQGEFEERSLDRVVTNDWLLKRVERRLLQRRLASGKMGRAAMKNGRSLWRRSSS